MQDVATKLQKRQERGDHFPGRSWRELAAASGPRQMSKIAAFSRQIEHHLASLISTTTTPPIPDLQERVCALSTPVGGAAWQGRQMCSSCAAAQRFTGGGAPRSWSPIPRLRSSATEERMEDRHSTARSQVQQSEQSAAAIVTLCSTISHVPEGPAAHLHVLHTPGCSSLAMASLGSLLCQITLL